jgi:hypothetical protein
MEALAASGAIQAPPAPPPSCFPPDRNPLPSRASLSGVGGWQL